MSNHERPGLTELRQMFHAYSSDPAAVDAGWAQVFGDLDDAAQSWLGGGGVPGATVPVLVVSRNTIGCTGPVRVDGLEGRQNDYRMSNRMNRGAWRVTKK